MVLKTLDEKKLKNKVGLIVGTRPGIIMFSSLIRECKRQRLDFFLIHAGQHYSYHMDKKFFEDLNLDKPHYKLKKMKDCTRHGSQTAKMLSGIENILIRERPKVVLVGGDANCNFAGALAARKLHIKVGHIEAGERSFDWRMPEEHNRVMIDHISEYLFATNEHSRNNLRRERVKGEILVTGNPIVDALYQNMHLIRDSRRFVTEYRVKKKNYFILTLHREENVDSKGNMAKILHAMLLVRRCFNKDIIFPIHPRTEKRMKEFGFSEYLKENNGPKVAKPVGYFDFLRLLKNSLLVFTDSGGVQQEACMLQVPCVTLRDTTEWVDTVKVGANKIVGSDAERIIKGARTMLANDKRWNHPFGDGQAAYRIAKFIKERCYV